MLNIRPLKELFPLALLKMSDELILEVNLPFREGHILSESEAKGCNQYYMERLRNRLLHEIKRGQAEPEHLQSVADSYVIVTRNLLDPVQEEAKRIAKRMIYESLNKKGMTKAQFQGRIRGDKFSATVQKLIDSRPDILEEARRVVQSNNDIFDQVTLPGGALAELEEAAVE